MLTRKTRTLIACLAATLAVAVVPATSHALTSKPTGDKALDDYCAKAAALIDKALSQGDLALIDGHDDEASEWYRLAADMIRRSQANGCDFGYAVARRIKRRLSRLDGGAVRTPPDLSVGGISTEPTPPRSVDGTSPLIGGIKTL